MKAISPREFLGDRPVPRACALAAVVVVVGWTSWIAGRHGILNPDRPRNAEAIGELMYDFHLDNQDQREILDFAKSQGGSDFDRRIQASIDAGIFRDIDESIDQHRRFARREADPPAGSSTDLAAFLAGEAPKFPDWARVGLSHVRTRTVLFEPGAECEMLCSTSQGAEKTFDEYIARLVEVRWAVESVQFHKGDRRGYFHAVHGDDASLFVAVMEKEVFPDAPTVIYWSLQGDFRGAPKKP